MILDQQTRKRLFGACDPSDPLDPGDGRNVELGATVRGADWTERLARDFELADKPLLRLFSGLPGSGKSTELRRLSRRLGQEDGAHLLVVTVDVEGYLDLATPLRSHEVLVAMFHEADRAVRRAESSPDDAPQSSFLSKILNAPLDVAKVEATLGPLKVAADLKNDPTLRERVDRLVRERPGAFLTEVRGAFEDLARRAIRAGYQGMIVLVDSLEKVRGISTNFDEVLKSAESVFAAGAPHLQLPVHTLYTLPPELVLRLREQVFLLPMIKLHDRNGQPHEPGFEAARAIVLGRLPLAALDALFGEAAREARVRELIAESGGYPREIVRLLRAVISTPTLVGEREMRKILIESGDTYRRVADGEGLAAVWFLARVHVHKSLFVNPPDRELAARLMAGNLILRYQNDDTWFDVHPAILELPMVKAAVEKLKEAPLLATGEPHPSA